MLPLFLSSSILSPTANPSDHAAGISLTALGDWKEVWNLLWQIFGRKEEWVDFGSVCQSTTVGVLVFLFIFILCV